MSKEKYNIPTPIKYTIETLIPTRYKWFWLFISLLAIAALIIAIIGLFLPTSSSSDPKRSKIDQFAITLTHKDIDGNVELFDSNGTVHFNRLMTFLNPPPVLSIGNWSDQISVFLAEFITNHMTFSICSENYTCIGYYTYTFDFGPNNTYNLPSVMCSFSAQFTFTSNDKIQSVEALPNATCTFVQYSFSGVEPPGPILSKKRSLTDLSRWNTLQGQIQSLITNGQTQQAIVACNTTQYLYLKSLFDPSGNTTVCRLLTHQTELTVPMVCTQEGLIDGSCFPPDLTFNSLYVTNLTAVNFFTSTNVSNPILSGNIQCNNVSFDPSCSIIQTINFIPPLASDFTFTGGPGIQMSGGMNSLTISNLGVLSVGLSAPSDEFNVTVSPVDTNVGTLTFVKKSQLQGLIWASPSNQTGVPIFRALESSDLPSSIPATLITGVLPVENGGTGFMGPYTPNQIIVSSSNGTYLRTGLLIPSFGINITNVNGNFIFGVNTTLVTLLKFQEVKLAAPSDIFNVTIDSVTQNGTLTFVVIPQAERTFWAGPLVGSGPNIPSFRTIDSSDLPLLNLTVLNFTGVLPITNGGTGSSISLNGNRVILSNSAGTAYTESSDLIDGSLIIGASAGSPQSAQLTAGSGISVINAANSITLKAIGPCTGGDKLSASCLDISNQACTLPVQSSCIPSGLSLTSLSVSGGTFLGTNTSCTMPLQPSCYDISSQQCIGGALNVNCIPPNLHLTDLTVDSLTVLNYTIGNVASQEFLNITNLLANQFTLTGSMTCSGNTSIDQNCLNLGGAVCPMGVPLSESCIPSSLVFYDLTVTHNLTINEITCVGPPMSSPCIQLDGETCSIPITDSCMQPRIKTINGVSPNGSLDFNVSSSTGISIVSLGNGILIGNTGVLSVGISVPSSEFTITGTNPVVSTGTLTFIKANQNAQTVWAGPVYGNSPAQPTFRALDINDLPPLSVGQVYSGNGTSNSVISISDIAITEIYLNAPVSLLSVSGSPLSAPGGNFTLSLVSQSPNQVFVSPNGSSGAPTFRSLIIEDLPVLLNGQVYIGSNTSMQAGYLTAGTGIFITNGPGSITINNTGLLSAGLNLPASVFNVSIPLITGLTGGGDLTAILIPQSANTFWGGPINGGPLDPTFRSITVDDLAPLSMTNGQLLIGSTGNAPVLANLVAGSNINITNLPGSIIISASINTSMIGTVMSVDMTVPSALLSVSGNPITSIGTFAVSLVSQLANKIFASPNGSSGTPFFRDLVALDLPLLGTDQIYVGFNGTNQLATLTAGTGVTIVNNGATVTFSTAISVGLALPTSIFSVSGSPVTSTGTLTGSLLTQIANTVWAGPVSGISASPTFRSLVPLDLPALGNGQLYIGNGGVPTVSSLSAGSGITITPGMGSLTISANFLGTVTSIGLSLPVSVFSISGSPITSSGTLTGSFVNQSANTVFAGPDGAGGTPTFRSLVAADIPNLDTSKLTSGILSIARGGTNSGTALNNNRIMVSNGSGAIVEAAALTNGQLLIGSTGAAPVAAALTAGVGISITNSAGGITIANNMTDMTMVVGEVFYEGATVTTTTLFSLTVNVAQELTPVTTLVASGSFDMPTNGRLRYTGSGTIVFHCAFSLSARLGSGATNQLIYFQLQKNGAIVSGGGFQQIFQNANDFQGMAFHKVVTLSTNNYISMYATDLTASKNFEIYNLNIVVAGSM